MHVPGPPRSPQPPPELVALTSSLHHPDVAQVGLTTTKDGEWALLVRLRRGVSPPVEEVELACPHHPIVYEPEPEPPVARPAYPSLGE